MAESFELNDEWELWLYAIALEILLNQKEAVLDASLFAAGYWDDQYTVMSEAFTPAIEEIMVGGIRFSTPTNLIDDVSSLFENQRIYAEQLSGKLIRNINDTTREKVNEIIQQSIVEGWDIPTLTQNLETWFSEMRARRIAVTETTNAFLGGAELSLQELNGRGKFVIARWLTANDDLVCPICAPRHLKVRGDGWTDMKAAHVGCRCDVAIEEVII